MAPKTNNQRRELSNLASNEKWHSIFLENDTIVENIVMSETGPKILGIKPHKKPSVEEIRASLIENGGYDVILVPGLEEKIEARFRYHPKNNGNGLPYYRIH